MVEAKKDSGMAGVSDNDEEEAGFNAADGRMVTALAWVSKGHAKAMLDVADPEADERNILMHARLQKKLAA